MPAAHPAESARCGSSSPKAIRARPLSIAARCAESPIRGLRKLGMPKPVSRPSVNSSAPMKHRVEERLAICAILRFTDLRSVSSLLTDSESVCQPAIGEQMTSQDQRRAATIAAILRAAGQLFTARGFDATSIDQIAARAGVAKGAVYHHFESKEQIFGRVFEQMTAALANEVVTAAAGGAGILDRFERGTLRYLTSIAGDKFCQ